MNIDSNKLRMFIDSFILFTRSLHVVSWGHSHRASQLLDAVKISCFEIFGGQKEIQVISQNQNQNDSKLLSTGALVSPSLRGQTVPSSLGFQGPMEEQTGTAPGQSSNYHFNK